MQKAVILTASATKVRADATAAYLEPVHDHFGG